MAAEYRVVPFVARADKRTLRGMGALSPAAAADQLEALIEAETGDGWEFHSVAHKSVRAPAQFIAWLLGFPPSTVWLDLVVFRRDTERDA